MGFRLPPRQKFESLKGQFLIAMPSQMHPEFFHSVLYVIEHSPEGAMAVIINQPLHLSVHDVLLHLGIQSIHELSDKTPALHGGPLQQERGLVLHENDGHFWKGTQAITDDVALTTSIDILEDIARGTGPIRKLFVLGFASWSPGQLEKEIENNMWLCNTASPEVLFSPHHELKWEQAGHILLGANIHMISWSYGHA